ncbi:hypothetical protein GCM10009839_14400 [Catenulispora yoronensis]|uniref:Uncharacterized protein n=1 Tax=Catenulispora yoronensis TaxID=450799 RepID=A0ABP5FAL0_9ACTN
MTPVPDPAPVAVLPLELGGSLRILAEAVDLTRGTVRWVLRGPHITGVVWLTREDPHDIHYTEDPGTYRCRLYSGDATGALDRLNDPVRINPLTCYRAEASKFQLGDRPTGLKSLAGAPIPDLSWVITAADRRTSDIRRALARHALASNWLQPLQHTWRIQTAAVIAARAKHERDQALAKLRSAAIDARHARKLLDALAPDAAEASVRGIAPLASSGRDLLSPDHTASAIAPDSIAA